MPAATGTIVNDDDYSAGALAWLSRFGRTVATQVVDSLESRFYGAFADESSVTPGGFQMRPGLAPDGLDEQAMGWDADMAFIHGPGLDGCKPAVVGHLEPRYAPLAVDEFLPLDQRGPARVRPSTVSRPALHPAVMAPGAALRPASPIGAGGH